MKKTSSITPFGTCCYMRMPEGLRNAGHMFCRMMKAALKDQVDRNIFSYIDDIIVASKEKASYISNLTEPLVNMREAKLKLNLEKCIFGITRGKVLGCLVSTKGIEASPNKIKAILQMQPLQTRKEVQKLAGRMAALNRFIAKLTERSLPLFSVLRGSKKVKWGLQQQMAFNNLKQYLQHLPMLSSPEQGQPLILYVSTTHSVVSRALVMEKETLRLGAMAKQQYPVYYMSEVIAGSKKYYCEVEKICNRNSYGRIGKMGNRALGIRHQF
jgi:hypothetical protein